MALIWDDENETYIKTGDDAPKPEEPCPACGEEMIDCEWCTNCGYPH